MRIGWQASEGSRSLTWQCGFISSVVGSSRQEARRRRALPRPRPGHSSPQGAAPRVPVLAGVARRAAPRPRGRLEAHFECLERQLVAVAPGARFWGNIAPTYFFGRSPNTSKTTYLFLAASWESKNPILHCKMYVFAMFWKSKMQKTYIIHCKMHVFQLLEWNFKIPKLKLKPQSQKHTFYTVKCVFFQFWTEISRFQTWDWMFALVAGGLFFGHVNFAALGLPDAPTAQWLSAWGHGSGSSSPTELALPLWGLSGCAEWTQVSCSHVQLEYALGSKNFKMTRKQYGCHAHKMH